VSSAIWHAIEHLLKLRMYDLEVMLKRTYDLTMPVKRTYALQILKVSKIHNELNFAIESAFILSAISMYGFIAL